MQDLKILGLQTELAWENPAKNRELLEVKIMNHATGHDLVILPETFTTGFPVEPEKFAENIDGKTMQWMASIASKMNTTLTGSFLMNFDGKYFNTLVWMRPDQTFELYQKRHVFRMGGEHERIQPGENQLIVELSGWKIKPMICYDLRFPVWCKNKLGKDGNYEYDFAFFVANWPEVRSYPWNMLLIARAIENQSYVAGINRVGYDGNGVLYSGNSTFINAKGKMVANGEEGKERALSVTLSAKELKAFREQFKVGLDWDKFQIK
jgi:predicted amidohydrolase